MSNKLVICLVVIIFIAALTRLLFLGEFPNGFTGVEAVRLPAALVGVLTILVVFFLASELTGSKKIAFWSAFLLAINPWHIQLSRTAFEGGIGVFFFSLGLLFFLR